MPKSRPILFGPLPPPYGGVSIFMSALAAAARARGVEVWSYTGERTAEFVNHRRLGQIARLLKGGRNARVTDSTHFHLEYPNPILLPLWLAAKSVMGFRWIKIVHDGSLPSRYEGFSSSQRYLFGEALNSIDEFVVPDAELERWLKSKIKTRAAVRVIPTMLTQPADWGTREPSLVVRDAVERFRRHGKRICSIGAFIASYGFADVVAAVETLRQDTGDDIGLMLVAGTFALDENFRGNLVDGRDWIYVLENVPHDELPAIYKNSDVFVRAFEHESYGISRVEALLCGTPVIATNVGETRGMLTYEFGDRERLADLIRGVLEGERTDDAESCARVFRAEVDRNLADYLNVGTGENA